MKIGIDFRNIGKKRTGDEVVFFNLVKNLAGIDNVNVYFLFTDITDSSILRSIEESLNIMNKPNFKIISLKCPNKFIWNVWTLPRYLKNNPVDVYHTQYITPYFIPKKIKIVTIIHDISFNFYPQYIKWTDLFFLKILIPHSLKRADKIIAVSNFTKNEIIRYYHTDPDKITVVHNAVADNFFINKYTDEQIDLVRNKYKLPEKFILYIGTMQPRKNIPLLIEAYAKMMNKLDGIKLVIAGKKSYNFDKNIDDVIRKLNLRENVLLPGYIDEPDKPILFKMGYLFVFPSLYEGFGIPILEAMSQGVPVVASDIISNRETGSGAVLYFDALNIANLQESLYNVYIDENLRNRLINSGLQRSKVFSWKKAAEKTLSIYQVLINSKD